MSKDVFNERMIKLLLQKDEKIALIKYYRDTDDMVMDSYRQNQISLAKRELQYLTNEIIKLRQEFGK